MSTPLLNLTLDQAVIEQIAHEFDLRPHNAEALRKLIFELTDSYDPETPIVLDMATGAGKTYLMAGFIEYLRLQGIRHVMIVTPGTVVQEKTVQNFTPGSRREIKGAGVAPLVTTPQDYSNWRLAQATGTAQLLGHDDPMQLFVFNIQQLIAPKSLAGETAGGSVQATQRKIRTFDENAGNLYEYLQAQDDLVVIADESHLYGSSAKAFRQAIIDLAPAATVGLTASADKSDHVVYRYPLWQAIADGMVKSPVIAYRASGYDDAGEELQLRDALTLLRNKQAAYSEYVERTGARTIRPVLFVVCADVEHATQVAALLRTPDYLASDDAVLQVDNQHNDAATQRRLDDLDTEYSTVQAVVSVNKLKEGWDTRSIAVLVTLRAMASDVLTQQTIGRGLRLPFGRRVGDQMIDTLDILSHESVRKALTSENVLREFGLDNAVDPETPVVPIEPAPAVGGGSADPTPPSGNAPGLPGTSGSGLGTGQGHVISLGHGDVGNQAVAGAGGQTTVQVVVLPDGEQLREVKNPKPVMVRVQDKYLEDGLFQTVFPVVTMAKTRTPFNASSIAMGNIRSAAERITDVGEVLDRDRVDVDAARRRLRLEGIDQASVESAPVDDETVATELLSAVLRDQRVPRSQENIGALKRFVVPTLMKQAHIDQWTVKSLGSASGRLRDLVGEAIREHEASAQTQTSILSRWLPQSQEYALKSGEAIHERIVDRAEFVPRRHYGGWSRSIFTAVAFDSYSGEYALAELMDKSPDIVWWYRLQRRDEAFIAYTPRDRYFPDFLAMDRDGVRWIVEGKDDRGSANDTVQLKRSAAEQQIARLAAEPHFTDYRWGYLLAYEGEVSQANSWLDLIASSSPVVTP